MGKQNWVWLFLIPTIVFLYFICLSFRKGKTTTWIGAGATITVWLFLLLLLFVFGGRISPETISAIVGYMVILNIAWAATQAFISERYSSADIVLYLYDKFFLKEENRKIIRAIERGTLELNPGKYVKQRLSPSNCDPQKVFRCDEEDLDDYLRVIKLIYTFWKKRVLDLEYIKKSFGCYICGAWNNTTVKSYIQAKGPCYYSDLKELVEKLGCNVKGK